MEERFSVKEIYICPVERPSVGVLKPNLEYPTRYCVIDEEKEIAIDIKTKLKYDYIRTMSHLYFISQSYEKIKGDKRVAIIPFKIMNDNNYDFVEAVKIINKLKSGIEFQDGNEVYNNKQYLEYIKQEALEEQKKQSKVKKITKKGK